MAVLEYNPLLETFVRERSWYDVAEAIQLRIERALAAGKSCLYDLNALDLIDTEAAAYWRGRANA